MSQVNKPPLGLQSFLGSQNFGDNPSELAQTVVPILDLFPYLSIYDLFSVVSSVVNVTGEVNNFANFTVPQGQAWLLAQVGCQIKFDTGPGAAGEGALITANIAQTVNSVVVTTNPIGQIVDFRAVDTSVTFFEYHAIQLPQLLPLRGGEVLQFNATRVNGTTPDIDIRASARYYKLNI